MSIPENPTGPAASVPRPEGDTPHNPGGWVLARPNAGVRSEWDPPTRSPLPSPFSPPVPAQPSAARPWIIALVVVSVLALLVGATAAVGGLATLGTNNGGLGTEDVFNDDPSSAFGEEAVYGEYIGALDFTGVRSPPGLDKGTCFTVGGLDEEYVGEIVARVCDAAHDKEAYASTTIPGDKFPGYDAVGARVYATCQRAFDDYVGADYEDSEADFGGLAPTEKGWAKGERDLVCFAFLYDDQRTGSLHDSGL